MTDEAQTGDLDDAGVDDASLAGARVDDAGPQDASLADAGVDDLEVEGDEEDVLLLAEHDAELVLPVWEPTGEPRVDAALDLITLLDPDDVHAHAAVFDDIHQQLRATLTDLDSSA